MTTRRRPPVTGSTSQSATVKCSGANHSHSSVDVYLARDFIQGLSPLVAGEVELLGAGTDTAFRVDGGWVVRFSLVPDAQGTLATEVALLPLIAPELPVAVPPPEHVARRDGRLAFAV